ncbi:MAG: hypothetical protein ABIH87_02605 [bacterium]
MLDAWIGLVIPVQSRKEDIRPTYRLLSKREVKDATGYYIQGRVAMSLLQMKDKKATTWWLQKAPHMFSDTLLVEDGYYEMIVVKNSDIDWKAISQTSISLGTSLSLFHEWRQKKIE